MGSKLRACLCSLLTCPINLLVHLQLDRLNLITGLPSKRRIAVFGLDSVLSSYYLALSAADK